MKNKIITKLHASRLLSSSDKFTISYFHTARILFRNLINLFSRIFKFYFLCQPIAKVILAFAHPFSCMA